jgi:peptidyl-prolyl cis-trans isomerase A (cyclophilin A)
MRRREWLLVVTCVLAGCGSGPASQVKNDPPVTRAPSSKEDGEEEIQLASADDSVPAKYRVKFETTAGDFVVEVHREWAPIGADRFYELVKSGFYDECKFFRVIQKPEPFMVQFGISGDPKVMDKWRDNQIKDDPVRKSNKRGMITFAKTGRPNSRTTQVFINYGNNSRLDNMGFAPFGEVIGDGMDVVEKLYSDYGGDPSDEQEAIQREGNKFLEKKYPKLDGIKKATLVNE